MSLDHFCARFPAYALFAPSWRAERGSSVSKNWSKRLALPQIDILYVFGLGDGSTYLQLKEWLHAFEKRRLIYLEEKPEPAAALFAVTDLFDDPQVDFALWKDDTPAYFAHKYPAAQIEAIALPGYSKARFQKGKLALIRETTLAHARFIDRLYGHKLLAHFVQNVPRFQGGFYANGLGNAFADIPAIVCGAGPSLAAAIPRLRELEGRALIIAGGSAITALKAAGIQPHFSLAVDPNLEEVERFQAMGCYEGPLLLSTRVAPGVFAAAKGPFGYLRSGVGGRAEEWFEEKLELTGPSLMELIPDDAMSVISLALAFAIHLGCSTIVLNGMDLAYTGNKRYAPGVTQENKVLTTQNVSDKLLRRKDKTGTSLNTAVRWVMEANTLGAIAKRHPHIRWINATEKGLGIDGIEEMDFDAVTASFQQVGNLRGRIDQLIAQNRMPDISPYFVQPLQESLKKAISHLEILAGVKRGSKALAELDLQEEIATGVLFSGIDLVLAQAEFLGLNARGYALYLEIAQKMLTVF